MGTSCTHWKNSPTQDTVEVSVAYTTTWGKRLEQESMKALKGGPYSLTIAKCFGKPLKGQGSFSRIIVKYTNLKEKALI